MITIGEVLKKLEVDIFNDVTNDTFLQKCREREKALKDKIIKADGSVREHINRPDLIGKVNHWQKEKIDRNIKKFDEYIERLCVMLDRDEIIQYCKTYNQLMPLSHEENDFIFLVNSYYATILYDILWDPELVLSDAFKISNGDIDKDSFSNRLPAKIENIKNVIIPFFLRHNDYSDFVPAIIESVDSFKYNNFKASSVLIMITIEGLVRKLGYKQISIQELDSKYLSQEFNSLDTFLRGIPWKNDIEIDKRELLFITSDYEFLDLKNGINYDGFTFVSLKTRLDFLRRTFKIERNSILHGQTKDIGDVWDLYRNFSALQQVYLTIKYYEEK